jgi:hypothetical protein
VGSLSSGSLSLAAVMRFRLYRARLATAVVVAALCFFLLLAQAADILVKCHAAEVFRTNGLELFRFDQARPYLVISISERDGRLKTLE